MLWFILEEQNNGVWRMFFRLGCKPGYVRSLLTWSAKWFNYQGASSWRLRRVDGPLKWHGIWDGRHMKHRPLCDVPPEKPAPSDSE